MERYIIYSVTKEEYDNCRIEQQNPKVVAMCNSPTVLHYVTITFRSFSPVPGGMEYKPGESYYFISTASKSDLYRRIGGRCSTNNMKAMFKVAPVDYDHNPVSVNVPRTGQGIRHQHQKKQLQQSLLNDRDYPSYPTYQDIGELDSNSVDHEKRSEDYDDHPNEVAKQASVMQPSSANPLSCSSLTFLWSSIVVVLLSLIL